MGALCFWSFCDMGSACDCDLMSAVVQHAEMEEWFSQSDVINVACDVLVPYVEKIYLTVGVTVDLHRQKNSNV